MNGYENTPEGKTLKSHDFLNPEKYNQLELGDVDQSNVQNQQSNQGNSNPHSTQFSQQDAPKQQNQNSPKQFDPLEFVKSMISMGFNPSKAQIMNAGNNATGPQSSSNTWFAIFLQRLIKQEKYKQSKKK